MLSQVSRNFNRTYLAQCLSTVHTAPPVPNITDYLSYTLLLRMQHNICPMTNNKTGLLVPSKDNPGAHTTSSGTFPLILLEYVFSLFAEDQCALLLSHSPDQAVLTHGSGPSRSRVKRHEQVNEK